jgi:hypothetical protein
MSSRNFLIELLEVLYKSLLVIDNIYNEFIPRHSDSIHNFMEQDNPWNVPYPIFHIYTERVEILLE